MLTVVWKDPHSVLKTLNLEFVFKGAWRALYSLIHLLLIHIRNIYQFWIILTGALFTFLLPFLCISTASDWAVPIVAQWVKNMTSIHEDSGSIPGLSGLRIPCSCELWHRPAAAAPNWPLAQKLPYAMGAALKRPKKNKNKNKKNFWLQTSSTFLRSFFGVWAGYARKSLQPVTGAVNKYSASPWSSGWVSLRHTPPCLPGPLSRIKLQLCTVQTCRYCWWLAGFLPIALLHSRLGRSWDHFPHEMLSLKSLLQGGPT